MKKGITTISLLVLVFLICIPGLQAQDPRGTIVGRVVDTSGGVIPGATVRARNLATNVTASTVTNDVGLYELPYLNPGSYAIQGELSGFKTWERPSVELRTGDRIAIDITLDVGVPSEVVQVTAEAPVLDSTSGNLGQVISPRQISELPLRSGNLAWVFNMAPGVVLQALPYDGPWNIAQASNLSVGGGGTRSFDFNVDGVTNNSYGGRTAFVPPPDMVQEVRIQTTTYDAQVGHTQGGSINVSMKSGTNAIHGSLSFSGASGPMFTRNFFTNRTLFNPATGPITEEKIKANTPSTRWLRYNASAGGPVYLPGLYDGRDKTFWMFGWQSHNRRRPVTQTYSVPTEEMKNGDFSALLARGANYQIYDPLTTVPLPNGRLQRQPFSGNIIPGSRIDPAARNMVKYYPAANATGTADFLNNYSITRQDSQDLYQPVVRIDHNFSENWRMFGRYSRSDFYGHFDKNIADSDVRGRIRQRPHRGVALDNVFVMSPQLVLDIRYGITWFREYQSFDNIGWDLKEFGFPGSLVSQLNPQAISFPDTRVTGAGAMLQLGNDGGFSQVYYQHSLLSVLSWTRNRHSIKAGLDGRMMFENVTTYGNISPRLNFGETYTRGPLDNSPVAPAGQGFASLLLGIPTGGWSDLNDSRAESTQFYGLFIQDDWRITKNLTLNMGLRWEYESPNTERFNRTTRQFDFQTANPIEAAAQANYAKSPIAEVPVGQFRTLGGVTFAGIGGNPRGVRDPSHRAFMPRLGFAYQFRSGMVLRGGYGLFYGLVGTEWTDVSQPGYNYRTNIIPSNDNGQTYVASISNPLPNGLTRPAGSSGGPLTFLGLSPGFFAEDGRRPYNQRWSLNIQWEVSPRNVLEVGYMGSRGVRNRVNRQFNPIPAEYLSTSPTRDQAAINFLSAKVTNPFKGISAFQGSSSYSATKINRSQILRPYPHFGNLATSIPSGSSWYHGMTARYERRFAKGLQFNANYTWSKNMEAISYLNNTDHIPEHVIASLDRPHRWVMNSLYELPFGKGKFLAGSVPGWVDQFIGGWQFQAIFQLQAGPPLNFGNVIMTGDLADLKLSGDAQSIDRWFNTDLFERNSKQQLASNIRTFPSRVAAARGPGINLWDLSMMKNFRLHEGVKLQLRCEAEGALNHPNMHIPNTTPQSSLFGKITRTQTQQEERRIFVGMKLLF